MFCPKLMMCGGCRSTFLPGPESTIEVEEVGVGVSHRLLDFLEGECTLLGIQPSREPSGSRNTGRPEWEGGQISTGAMSAVLCLVPEM